MKLVVVLLAVLVAVANAQVTISLIQYICESLRLDPLCPMSFGLPLATYGCGESLTDTVCNWVQATDA